MKRDKRYQRPPVRPLMFGGPQERGYRPGTTPVALAAGFALAAELSDKESAQRIEVCRIIREELLTAISPLVYQLNGNPSYCLPSTVNVSFTGVDAEGVFVALKDQYAVSNGSACNSGSHAPSYVLTAMGLSEKRINEAVRISWGAETQADFTGLVDYIRSMQ
jgi:cysteine desulfurase